MMSFNEPILAVIFNKLEHEFPLSEAIPAQCPTKPLQSRFSYVDHLEAPACELSQR